MEVVKNGQKEEKKPTNAQLQRRIQNAVIHVDRTKDTKEVFFDDRNIRVVVNEDAAYLSNGIYTTIFQRHFFGGESNQYQCLKLLVELAEQYKDDIVLKDKKGNDFRSFEALSKVLEEKNDDSKTWFTLMSWFIFNLELDFGLAPKEEFTDATYFSLYEKTLHSAKALEVFSAEHKEGMSNKEYFKEIAARLNEAADEMMKMPMFVPKSDDDRMKEELDALQRDMDDKILEEQANDEQQKE